jgi:hypothetical protein
MHAEIERALQDSRTATGQWRALAGGLSHAQANWRPAPESWSIAQCMDHLTATTGPLVPAINAAVTRARASGRLSTGPFRYGFVATWFLRSLAPAGARPVRAPGLYRPSASDLDLVATASRFFAVQEAFEEAATSADGIDLARVRVASPALAILRLPLGTWFLATAAHTLRHLHQAQRVRTDPRFAGAA